MTMRDRLECALIYLIGTAIWMTFGGPMYRHHPITQWAPAEVGAAMIGVGAYRWIWWRP